LTFQGPGDQRFLLQNFQVAGAEQRNARLANAILANGSDNRAVVAERRVRTPSDVTTQIRWRRCGQDLVYAK